MKPQKFLSVASVLTVVSATTFTGSINTFAADTSQIDSVSQSVIAGTLSDVVAQSAKTIHQISSSTALWRLSQGVGFDAKSLTATQNGITEKLPTTAIDRNGSPVCVSYKETGRGIEVHVNPIFQIRGFWRYIAGIGDGVIGGGTGGGLAGAAVGAATLSIVDAVSASVVGLIEGTVGGGLSGVAAFC